ncbi:hypothetical protein M1N57_01270 [Dehalococcoidales bacterium]|nr:hypothetical protein [Dehalococcoidales bacterium]
MRFNRGMYGCPGEKVVKLPSYGEVMEEVKAEVLRLVGEKVVEFQEFRAWFGKPWQREKDARSGVLDVATAQALSAGEGGVLSHPLWQGGKCFIPGQGMRLHLLSLRWLLCCQGQAVFQGPGSALGAFPIMRPQGAGGGH